MARANRRVAVHEIRNVAQGATPTHAHLRGRLTFVLFATVALDLVASVLAGSFGAFFHRRGMERDPL